MANYVGSARSNYFRVRDEGEFRRWGETLPGVVIDREEDDPNQFVLLVETGDDGGWPTCRFDEEGDCSDLDLFGELAGHLAPGEVAILEEVGAEKLRYLIGYAVAVNSSGERIAVSIDDIYERVREAGWGEHITSAAY
ncbi:hypothetical protein [Rubrobacter radiotolerans]|uniref:DUF4265 domain-containing protein n=1 Tax=Rubrobacter radiotolerans TaxID=42256 RepID=A0AB35T933_RUBRA|nr:hypothetical protein [Rubrobacter radiotolerans]MDX5895172.1 hypothetical protein [Rubrobacter radiotolerans]SMC07590.1 conserved hypothetical protein [Rubrobacter radiotolerans DSM 5868]